MITYSATYDPSDNKLRLYAASRLDAETYARVKAAGFAWAPKQDCFVAPMWTPAREDLLLELAGEIDDEDTTLVERAEQRAERFEDYSAARQAENDTVHTQVDHIVRMVNGNPILVGHHSEKRARKDQERIFGGMHKAVTLWRQAQYWQERAQGVLAHAQYKDQPDVRARRIKGLEADLRKQERTKDEAAKFIALWQKTDTVDNPLVWTLSVANYDHIHLPNGHSYGWSLYAGLEKGACTPEQARDLAIETHQRTIAYCERWIEHYTNRLAYERTLLEAQGGTVADQSKPEKGGACRCWVKSGQWIEILKVNKVSVTVADNWGNGGRDFTRTIPFDQLKGVMTKAEWQTYQAARVQQASEPEQPVVTVSEVKAPVQPTTLADLASQIDVASEGTQHIIAKAQFEAEWRVKASSTVPQQAPCGMFAVQQMALL